MIGECFFYDTPPNGKHMFIVLAPSMQKKGWFICTNVTEKRDGSDTSCELLQGEHPNLTKPISIVNYALTRELPLPLIARLIEAQQLPKMGEQPLLRIQQQALGDMSRMKKNYQDAIRKYTLNG